MNSKYNFRFQIITYFIDSSIIFFLRRTNRKFKLPETIEGIKFHREVWPKVLIFRMTEEFGCAWPPGTRWSVIMGPLVVSNDEPEIRLGFHSVN